ncbi:Dfm1p KNAG_0C04450 [Huiozyma naganishii CBS 8797]|uniref:Derlin n=1 Tax=Huiozyma naganishii (strain ATCC MYA-139 / BCRC 22969 / CBS 8797 / KCTC 17520 / NBRC 10181 / NCYC 3082 / Yp74L-3) TaxID=1071383 RepID=J7RWZ1_HUIN7|nr:hypothetical protein KNAG_0C04450 [Kazachstania naganishii CBS 8797]CCK69547.1 hypothetical protein KNAG_0C04450 [Kazachstania naganishii CBS 8797]
MRNIHTLKNADGSSKKKQGSVDSSEDDISLSGIWKSFPPITRTMVLGMCLVSASYILQLVPFSFYIFQGNEVIHHFQLWRLVTSFLILPANSMNALFQLYTITTRSVELERERFLVSMHYNPSIDYLFYLIFCTTFVILFTVMRVGTAEPLVLTDALSTLLTMTWSIDNANSKVMFYGVLPIYGKYYPVVQSLTTFVFGGNLEMLGISLATAYLFACLDTRTLGPVWGKITGKGPWYGIVPVGKFHAPRWFVAGYEFFFGGTYAVKIAKVKREEKKAHTGQRLGSLSSATTTSDLPEAKSKGFLAAEARAKSRFARPSSNSN